MARQGYPSDKQDQFMVRFPEGMRDRIKAAAEASNRSMNAEIVAALEELFPSPPKFGELRREAQETSEMLAEMDALMRRWLKMRRRIEAYKSPT